MLKKGFLGGITPNVLLPKGRCSVARWLAMVLVMLSAMTLTIHAATATLEDSEKTQRTTRLDFVTNAVISWNGGSGNPTTTNLLAPLEGWAWYKTATDDYAANTLVLNGLDLDISASSNIDVAVHLPAGSTIVLMPGTTNNVANNSVRTTGNTLGISSTGNLVIQGAGNLIVKVGSSTAFTHGINMTGTNSLTIRDNANVEALGGSGGTHSFGITATNITIDGSTVTTAGGSASTQSFGINSGTGTNGSSHINILNGAVVNATGGASPSTMGIRNWGDANNIVMTGSTITAAGGTGTTSFGINGAGSIIINSGNVTAAGNSRAFGVAPDLTAFSGVAIQHADNVTGDSPTTGAPANWTANTIKWVRISLDNSDNEAITAAKELIEETTFAATQANVATEAAAKAAVEAIIGALDLDGVVAVVVAGDFEAAVAGTAENINGTNGSFKFTVTLNKGAGTQQITEELMLTITATPYDATQDNEDISAAKTAVEGATFTVGQANVATAAAAKAAVETIIGALELDGVIAVVVAGDFEAAVAGTAENINGTNGSFKFTITLNKGAGTEQITEELTLTITATAYDPPNSINGARKSDSRYGIRFAQNPASDIAEISVILPNSEKAVETNVVIYDMTGNVVFACKGTACLARSSSADKANLVLTWDLRNSAGRFVANGSYLVVAEVKDRNGRTHRYSARLGVKR